MNWKERLRASGLHLAISLCIAALAALLVFGVWYPYPYREVSGGRELFLLVVTVDVILGPLITLAIFNRKKPWKELRRDLAFVGLLQIAGLAYGLDTVREARPVHLVFEIDRFRVIHAIDVVQEFMDRKPAAVEAMPLTGPTLLGVRPFKSSSESMEATVAALQGVNLGARPDLWQPYDANRPDVRKAAKPVEDLRKRFPAQLALIDAAISRTGRAAASLAYLPLASRKAFWTVLVDPSTADVIGFIPLDPF